MRNRAAALLVLTLTTSCSRAPRHDQRSTAPVATHQPTTTTTAIAPTSGPSTSAAAPSTSNDAFQTEPVPVGPDASTFATEVVDQLIAGAGLATVPDAELWASVTSGGQVIQTTVLADSADRANVAVSVAFQPTPGEGDIEPIGLRIDLLHAADGWNVIAIGYL